MNFSEERWVKLYTRDTTGWRMLTWQARCVLLHAFRKVDRSGAIDLDGDGLDGLAVMLDLPPEIVETAMSGRQGLVARGAAEIVTWEGRTFFLLPRFVEAQEAKSTPRARKAASRALAMVAGSDVPRLAALGQLVTKRDHESQPVTESHAPSHEVTHGHTASRSDQNRSEQIRTEQIPECERERPRAILKCDPENPESKQVGPSHTTVTVPNPSPLAVPGPRAAETTSPATLAAPEPQKPVLVQRGAKVADLGKGIDLDQPMAAWAMPRHEAIRMAKGISLDVPGEWLAFVTHLATLREQGVVRPVCEAEWSKWIQNADRFGGKSRPAPAAAKPPPPPSPKAPEPEVYIPTDEERATFFANLRALSSAPIELPTVPLEPTEKRKPSEAEVAAFEAKRAKALAKAKLAFPDDFGDV